MLNYVQQSGLTYCLFSIYNKVFYIFLKFQLVSFLAVYVSGEYNLEHKIKWVIINLKGQF